MRAQPVTATNKNSLPKGSKRSDSEKDFLIYNLFKPPKHDTYDKEFFYYTEVYSEWIERK